MLVSALNSASKNEVRCQYSMSNCLSQKICTTKSSIEQQQPVTTSSTTTTTKQLQTDSMLTLYSKFGRLPTMFSIHIGNVLLHQHSYIVAVGYENSHHVASMFINIENTGFASVFVVCVRLASARPARQKWKRVHLIYFSKTHKFILALPTVARFLLGVLCIF